MAANGRMTKYLSVWAVHLLTASGAGFALVAAIAAARGSWQLVFLFLGLAMIVDGVDGPIARKVHVAERLPWFNGATLDLVVDFTTYVLVPALVLSLSDLLTQPFATGAGIVVAVVGALYFADTRMKTEDLWFRGFPATWNILILYLFLLRPPWILSAAILLGATALMFAPVAFVHPLRVVRLRGLTIAITLAWFAFAAIAIFENLSPPVWVVGGLVVTAAYFLALPLLRHSPWAHD